MPVEGAVAGAVVGARTGAAAASCVDKLDIGTTAASERARLSESPGA